MKLGLPIEYQILPEFFECENVIHNPPNTDIDNIIIEKILASYGVQSVLDMTCGTGSQVFYLTSKGYNVVGSDFSPALIEFAQKKNSCVKFIHGDMRTLKVEKFDAVITIWNAIGHLTKSDFELAMRNIHSNLKNNGIYIFDILNLNAMTDDFLKNNVYQSYKRSGDTIFLSSQCGTLDREKGLLHGCETVLVQKNLEKPLHYYNESSLQIYTASELKTMLNNNGFELLSITDGLGNQFVDDKSFTMLIAARAK